MSYSISSMYLKLLPNGIISDNHQKVLLLRLRHNIHMFVGVCVYWIETVYPQY